MIKHLSIFLLKSMALLAIISLNDICAIRAQNILEVGIGKVYANPQLACMKALPGDTILIYPGKYSGGYYIENLKGKSNARITIKGINVNTVIIEGGSEAFHFAQLEYVNLQDLTVQGQSGNGINMDDGGTYDTPSKHVLIRNVSFLDMNATGNNDMLKLSGLDSFEIVNCRFNNGSAGGSGIDMVGCHYGWIHSSMFTNQGSNSIQAKGGCYNIHIEGNRFNKGGQRTLNLGGSTGVAFFRPLGANYEAKNLLVNSNYFIGSDAPIAYVGCRNVQVSNNTFVSPTKWIFRILQESSDTSFYLSCANNIFSNNIVYCSSLSPTVNIGPNTSEKTFVLNNNLWYNAQTTNWRGPTLPVVERNAIYSQDPLFENLLNGNINLKNNSPAIGKGFLYSTFVLDINGFDFKNPACIGAAEYYPTTHSNNLNVFKCRIYPNPCKDWIWIDKENDWRNFAIFNSSGIQVIQNDHQTSSFVDVSNLISGTYYLVMNYASGQTKTGTFIKD